MQVRWPWRLPFSVSLLWSECIHWISLPRGAGIALTLAFLIVFGRSRDRAPTYAILAVLSLAPFYSVLSHWWENEQRGHLFGYWFGHDMFTPPFEVYPEMDEGAILFGGTDPGRFNPTYMIFCSFLPSSKKPRDPDFDRRDVYLITQNALADGTIWITSGPIISPVLSRIHLLPGNASLHF